MNTKCNVITMINIMIIMTLFRYTSRTIVVMKRKGPEIPQLNNEASVLWLA